MAGSELFQLPVFSSKNLSQIEDKPKFGGIILKDKEEPQTESPSPLTSSRVDCNCHHHSLQRRNSLFVKACSAADQAVQADKLAHISEAVSLYDRAVELFLEALQNESNTASTTTSICVKCEKCLARAHLLRNTIMDKQRSTERSRPESRLNSLKRRSKSLFQTRKGNFRVRTGSDASDGKEATTLRLSKEDECKLINTLLERVHRSETMDAQTYPNLTKS